MWQRSHEIICLYISSKPAKGLREKSGYLDILILPGSWQGLKQEDKHLQKISSLKRCSSLGRGHILPSQRFVH